MDEDKMVMLDVVCFSEKENVSLIFGFEIAKIEADNRRLSDTNDLAIGICDSYWELWEEFYPGIGKAKKLFDEGRFATARESLFNVFGHFGLKFSIDDVELDFDCEFDADECMYELLEQEYQHYKE